MDWEKRLTQEKSISQVYSASSVVASSRFNRMMPRLLFLGLIILSGVNSHFGMKAISLEGIVDGLKEVSEIGFAFSTAILGFLISGFAIFAGISKPDILILLAKTDHGKYDISELQFIFFNFLGVFIHFLLFLTICILVKSTFYSTGIAQNLLDYLGVAHKNIANAIASILFSLAFCWLISSILLLKSFIWNLYQAILVTILIEAELISKSKTVD